MFSGINFISDFSSFTSVKIFGVAQERTGDPHDLFPCSNTAYDPRGYAGHHAYALLPFLLFPNSSKTPKFIRYLGKVLPYAVMGMLVVYCLRNVSFTTAPFGAPEALALACVAGLHLWKKNTLLSIGAGTTLYMVLIQFVFI